MSSKKLNSKKEYKLSEEDVIEIIKKANDSFELLKEYNSEIPKTMDFATYSWNLAIGAFNPMTTNETLKSLNVHTLVPTKEKIDEALRDPTNNEVALTSYGFYYYFSNLTYKRNVEILKSLPAFDLSVRCINLEKPEDINSKEYKEDNKIVKEFLQKFDYRSEFKIVLWNLIMSETYFTMFRKFKNRYKLQAFPNQYALLTGEWEYGLLYDIDINYFANNTMVDIDMFPESIKKKFNEIYGNRKSNEYKPSNPIDKRNGTFANYIQTSPKDGFFAFKFNMSHNLNIPFYSATLPEMAILPIIRDLQLNQSMAAAKKIIAADVPYIKDIKGAGLTNKVAIDPTELKRFVDTVAHGLQGLVKLLYTPTEKSTGIEFKNTDADAYNNFMSITSQLLSGSKSNVNVSSRENAIQTKIAMNMDELIVEEVYPQFNDFLNYYVNNETKKYKFEFRFEGCKNDFSKTRRQNEAFTLADKGIISLNKIANAFGMNKYELEDEVNEAKYSGFTNKLQLLLNINTMSKQETNSSNAGRPQKEEADLSDSGSATRNAGSNVEKGGKI